MDLQSPIYMTSSSIILPGTLRNCISFFHRAEEVNSYLINFFQSNSLFRDREIFYPPRTSVPRKAGEMHCYDLTRFHHTKSAVPNQVPVFPALVRFRPVRASTGASIHGGLVSDSVLRLYDLLGLPVSGSLVEIKHAYKQMARKYHPDVSPPDRVEEYTQKFLRVHEAYETLSRKAMYDSGEMDDKVSFSGGRPFQYDEDLEWKVRWQSQVSELRSRRNKSRRSESWGERLRRRREESDED